MFLFQARQSTRAQGGKEQMAAVSQAHTTYRLPPALQPSSQHLAHQACACDQKSQYTRCHGCISARTSTLSNGVHCCNCVCVQSSRWGLYLKFEACLSRS